MPDTPNHAPLLTAQELADQLQVTVAHVHRLAKCGVIGRYRLGHRTHRYDLGEVLAALREQERAPVTPPLGAAPSRPAAHPKMSTLPAFNWSPGS